MLPGNDRHCPLESHGKGEEPAHLDLLTGFRYACKGREPFQLHVVARGVSVGGEWRKDAALIEYGIELRGESVEPLFREADGLAGRGLRICRKRQG